MKYVSGKVIVLIMIALLSTVVMRRSSAQFDCNPPGGGGGDPTPTATPACYDTYDDLYEVHCGEPSGFCCESHYLVVYHYCYGVLIGVDQYLVGYYCWED
jgi:hypothetical protein